MIFPDIAGVIPVMWSCCKSVSDSGIPLESTKIVKITMYEENLQYTVMCYAEVGIVTAGSNG
jgi:hypothetical protein